MGGKERGFLTRRGKKSAKGIGKGIFWVGIGMVSAAWEDMT